MKLNKLTIFICFASTHGVPYFITKWKFHRIFWDIWGVFLHAHVILHIPYLAIMLWHSIRLLVWDLIFSFIMILFKFHTYCVHIDVYVCVLLLLFFFSLPLLLYYNHFIHRWIHIFFAYTTTNRRNSFK